MDIITTMYILFYITGMINGLFIALAIYVIRKLRRKNKLILPIEPDELE